jgi:hypothetical protein
MRKGRGTLILVLAILAFVCSCLPLGVPAWIMGRADLRRMDRGEISTDDRTITRVGMILGAIATLLLLPAIVWGMFMGGVASLLAILAAIG